jgi:hypothetical protein
MTQLTHEQEVAFKKLLLERMTKMIFEVSREYLVDTLGDPSKSTNEDTLVLIDGTTQMLSHLMVKHLLILSYSVGDPNLGNKHLENLKVILEGEKDQSFKELQGILSDESTPEKPKELKEDAKSKPSIH